MHGNNIKTKPIFIFIIWISAWGFFIKRFFSFKILFLWKTINIFMNTFNRNPILRSNIAFKIWDLHIDFVIIVFISIFWKGRKKQIYIGHTFKKRKKSSLIIRRWSSEKFSSFFLKRNERSRHVAIAPWHKDNVFVLRPLCLNPAMPSQQRVLYTALNDKSFRHFSGIKKNLTLFHRDAT